MGQLRLVGALNVSAGLICTPEGWAANSCSERTMPRFVKADVEICQTANSPTAAWMQVSRTPSVEFELCSVSPGVGEALKREIAGLFLDGSGVSMGICEVRRLWI